MKILIGGDSVGCGEWTKKEGNTHRGLEYYLKEEGHEVTNVSGEGLANKKIIERFSQQLQNKKFDIIFFFQGDPIKDLGWHTEQFVNFLKTSNSNPEMFHNYEHLIKIQKNIINITYNKLNNLNIPIHCIGGGSGVDIQLISKYKNLIPIMQEMAYFITGIHNPEVWFTGDWAVAIGKQLNLETLDRLVEQKRILDKIFNHPSFVGEHPGRDAHYKLFLFLKENVIEAKAKELECLN